MKGYGKAYGAVSIVNAISTGKGAALGIKLETEAEVKILEDSRDVYLRNSEHDPSLAREVIRTAAEVLGIEKMGAEIETRSNIPVAVGLKSSSSAAVAIALATLDALGRQVDDETLLKIVAKASLRSGTSITGAMDDAAACLLGGIAITDNHAMRLIRHEKADEKLKAVISIPDKRTYTRDFRKELLDPIKELAEEAFNLALSGKYWRAMTLNGLIHAAALSIDIRPIIQALRRGALAAGVSGTGPAIAAVGYGSSIENVYNLFEELCGKCIVVEVNNEHGKIGRR